MIGNGNGVGLGHNSNLLSDPYHSLSMSDAHWPHAVKVQWLRAVCPG